MKKFYSKINPDVLLHLTSGVTNLKSERTDISPEEEYLQLALLKLKKGKTFRPHKHIIKEKITDIAQESWFVYRGSVECIFYDLDDSIISKEIIKEGELSITFRGGHNYRILEEDTIVLEYKTGPYLGIENDKKFIK
tara:strand:+ start:947 stop:1357 length:411 start_codon:yes stop_codon:yes gene_type:complete